MATATHYDAFDLLEHMFNRVQHQPQHQPQSQRCAPSRKETPASVETRLIRMDVSESEQAYTVLAELPGVKKEQLEVRIEGKQVYIQGQVVPAVSEAATSVPNASSTNLGSNANPANATAPERQLLNERFYGKLERRIQLPLEIDEAQAQAKFADGILQLQLPKKRLAGAHKLEIF